MNLRKQLQVRTAIEGGLLESNGAISIVDIGGVEANVAKLISAFPENFLHCFAVKSNHEAFILRLLNACGMGAEVASPNELRFALAAGFEPDKMVFDAPVKTQREIEDALKRGIAFNIDNFQEFERVREFVASQKTLSTIGFRINPQIGSGSVALSSTATQTSKFGVGLKDEGNRQRLIEAYSTFPWFTGIHVHVGSVGCPLELIAQGIAETVRLVHAINDKAGFQQIKTIDIGGGLPVNFKSDLDDPDFETFAAVLKQYVPELFSGDFKVITEFGRAIVAKHALTIAKVEYTKVTGGRHIALTHAGVHNLMRVVFQPQAWERRVSVVCPNGSPSTAERVKQDVAGPCCFTGDIIAHERNLPLMKPDDYVVVHDTGAYCFSNHFQYNAMGRDPVYLWQNDERLVAVQLDEPRTSASMGKVS